MKKETKPDVLGTPERGPLFLFDCKKSLKTILIVEYTKFFMLKKNFQGDIAYLLVPSLGADNLQKWKSIF